MDYFSSPNATPNPLAPTPRGLSVMSGEIWRHGAYATLRQSQPELPQGRRRGRSQACLSSPGSGQDPPGSHVAPCPGLVHKALYICRKNGVPQKTLWILCTIVLIRGAAGGQPAPCYRDGIQGLLFQGGKQECAQHFNVCSVKKINKSGIFFSLQVTAL